MTFKTEKAQTTNCTFEYVKDKQNVLRWYSFGNIAATVTVGIIY